MTHRRKTSRASDGKGTSIRNVWSTCTSIGHNTLRTSSRAGWFPSLRYRRAPGIPEGCHCGKRCALAGDGSCHAQVSLLRSQRSNVRLFQLALSNADHRTNVKTSTSSGWLDQERARLGGLHHEYRVENESHALTPQDLQQQGGSAPRW